MTLERILDAAEAELGESSWSRVSVQALARRAGYSTGALYARFPNKASILPALLERSQELVQVSLADFESRTADLDPRATFDRFVDMLMVTYRERGGLLKGMREAAREDPELSRQLQGLNEEILQRVHRCLRSKLDLHSEAHHKLDVLLLMVVAVMRDLFVGQEIWPQEAHAETWVAQIKTYGRHMMETLR